MQHDRLILAMLFVALVGHSAVHASDSESIRRLTTEGEKAFQRRHYDVAESQFRRALLKSIEQGADSKQLKLCLRNLQRALESAGKHQDAVNLGRLSKEDLRKLLANANAQLPKGQEAMTNETESTKSAPIGYATMLQDKTIQLDLRRTADGHLARSLRDYKPDDPNYAEVLKHIGELKPGERKLVYPWP